MAIEKKFTVTVTADTEQKCAEKLTAAISIMKDLPHDDLIGLAQLIKEKPGIIAKAKSFKSWF